MNDGSMSSTFYCLTVIADRGMQPINPSINQKDPQQRKQTEIQQSLRAVGKLSQIEIRCLSGCFNNHWRFFSQWCLWAFHQKFAFMAQQAADGSPCFYIWVPRARTPSPREWEVIPACGQGEFWAEVWVPPGTQQRQCATFSCKTQHTAKIPSFIFSWRITSGKIQFALRFLLPFKNNCVSRISVIGSIALTVNYIFFD